jgi:hypothetical protein
MEKATNGKQQFAKYDGGVLRVLVSQPSSIDCRFDIERWNIARDKYVTRLQTCAMATHAPGRGSVASLATVASNQGLGRWNCFLSRLSCFRARQSSGGLGKRYRVTAVTGGV